MRSPTLARVLGIFVLAVVIGGLIGWWASRNPNTDPAQPKTEPSAPVENVVSEPKTEPVANADAPVPDVASNTNAFDPALWDEKLDEILGDPNDDTDRKAREMLDMMD